MMKLIALIAALSATAYATLDISRTVWFFFFAPPPPHTHPLSMFPFPFLSCSAAPFSTSESRTFVAALHTRRDSGAARPTIARTGQLGPRRRSRRERRDPISWRLQTGTNPSRPRCRIAARVRDHWPFSCATVPVIPFGNHRSPAHHLDNRVELGLKIVNLQVSKVAAGTVAKVTFNTGCTQNDQYGSNDCSLVWGNNYTVT